MFAAFFVTREAFDILIANNQNRSAFRDTRMNFTSYTGSKICRLSSRNRQRASEDQYLPIQVSIRISFACYALPQCRVDRQLNPRDPRIQIKPGMRHCGEQDICGCLCVL